MAKTINESRKVVVNVLKNADNCGKRKVRSQCLTARDKCAVIASDSSLQKKLQLRQMLGMFDVFQGIANI